VRNRSYDADHLCPKSVAYDTLTFLRQTRRLHLYIRGIGVQTVCYAYSTNSARPNAQVAVRRSAPAYRYDLAGVLDPSTGSIDHRAAVAGVAFVGQEVPAWDPDRPRRSSMTTTSEASSFTTM